MRGYHRARRRRATRALHVSSGSGRRISIGADRSIPTNRSVTFRDGKGDTARAAPKLEDRSVRPAGEVYPEPNVAPADSLLVLPVVERRILIPALPSLHTQLPSDGIHHPPGVGARRQCLGGGVSKDPLHTAEAVRPRSAP